MAVYILGKGHGGLFNTGEAGTIVVTNFLLVFLSEESMEVNALGTIPLATIEKFNKIVSFCVQICSPISVKSFFDPKLMLILGRKYQNKLLEMIDDRGTCTSLLKLMTVSGA
uniref:Uncharacterized protein n=1 Tax=Lactuca sativa TaxID=4236 RepID=A0A9R1X4U4_LACSA|nr:hypothetical protein LSAT_V11C600328810 [Lactuca sativa]